MYSTSVSAGFPNARKIIAQLQASGPGCSSGRSCGAYSMEEPPLPASAFRKRLLDGLRVDVEHDLQVFSGTHGMPGIMKIFKRKGGLQERLRVDPGQSL